MDSVKFTTCMAKNADFICRGIADYVGARLGVATEFINDIGWQERERRFDAGEIDVCWICGLPYVWKVAAGYPDIELLAAPVMSAPRYRGRPVYFSDVVVRRESAYYAFSDLRDTRWAINESHSHSGYNLVRYHLAMLGEPAGFFRTVIESGAHQNSLRLIVNGEIDAAAIDSTVLEAELERYPELAARLRVIETLGPSPIPPWVISRRLPQSLRARLRALLLNMHDDDEGRALLAQARWSRFAAVADNYYDLIRSMADKAESVSLMLSKISVAADALY